MNTKYAAWNELGTGDFDSASYHLTRKLTSFENIHTRFANVKAWLNSFIEDDYVTNPQKLKELLLLNSEYIRFIEHGFPERIDWPNWPNDLKETLRKKITELLAIVKDKQKTFFPS